MEITDVKKCSYCGHQKSLDDYLCLYCGNVFWNQVLGTLLFYILVPFVIYLFIPKTLTWKGYFIPLFIVVFVTLNLFRFTPKIIKGQNIRRNFNECDALPPRHEFLEWEYENIKSCIQSSNCLQCGKYIKQLLHERWSDWQYESDTSCIQVRFCYRCGEVEKRISHEEGAIWKYENDNSCIQMRTCHRCREKEMQGPCHIWKSNGFSVVDADGYHPGEKMYRVEHYICEHCGENKYKKR